MVTAAILEAGGVPFRLREARRRLLILTTGASNGGPAIIESEGGFVYLSRLTISLKSSWNPCQP